MRLPLSIAAILLVAGSACAQPSVAEPSGRIDWEIEPSGQAGQVQLEISRRSGSSHWSIGRTIEASALDRD